MVTSVMRWNAIIRTVAHVVFSGMVMCTAKDVSLGIITMWIRGVLGVVLIV